MTNQVIFLVIFAGTAVLAVLSDRIRFFARHELLTGVLLVSVALAAILVRMLVGSALLCDAMLRVDLERIETDIDDQLGYAMLRDADSIADYLRREAEPSREKMAEAVKLFGYDEINVVDAKGVVTASNVNPTGVPFSAGASRAPYGQLLDGTRAYVKERFRDMPGGTDDAVKYLGVRMPQGGFIQLGYYWSNFGHDFEKHFIQTFESRRVGDTGFFLIVNPEGRVVHQVAGHPEATGMTLEQIGLRASDLLREPVDDFDLFDPDTFCVRRVLGQWCLCDTYERVGEWKGFAILPLADVLAPAAGSALFAAVILIIFCVVFRLMLVRLRKAQAKIDDLRAQEEARRAADLALASAIQNAELRTDGLDDAQCRLVASMEAAREVGGDFYDYYALPDGRLVVTIADVSGKGVPAAFFMMKARMTLKSAVFSSDNLAEAVAKANARLAANNAAEMFVTAWVGVWDPRTGALDYVSAGHNPPLKVGKSGSVAWLEAPRAAALGVFEKAKYRAAQTQLAPGDRLFLYTDGVTEAMNAAGELFGNDRLEATLAAVAGRVPPAEGLRAGGGDAADLIQVVKRALASFVAGAEQSDDITMLELEVREPLQP